MNVATAVNKSWNVAVCRSLLP
jgi:hypothetical protein